MVGLGLGADLAAVVVVLDTKHRLVGLDQPRVQAALAVLLAFLVDGKLNLGRERGEMADLALPIRSA